MSETGSGENGRAAFFVTQAPGVLPVTDLKESEAS
jgi:hypothetical protein